jgi:hypothetical protein
MSEIGAADRRQVGDASTVARNSHQLFQMTRASVAVVSKYRHAVEVHFSSRSSPEPLQAAAAPRHPGRFTNRGAWPYWGCAPFAAQIIAGERCVMLGVYEPSLLFHGFPPQGPESAAERCFDLPRNPIP